MVKISVIIPVYNVEAYIEKCLDSVLRQTLQDIEIIVIDDCCQDNSMRIVGKYDDPRIKIIHNPKNLGVSAARNAGLAAAAGEYIGFVDPDDWIEPDYYEKLYSAAKGADIVMGSKRYIYPNGRTRIQSSRAGVFEAFADKLDQVKTGSVWDKIYKCRVRSEELGVNRSCDNILYSSKESSAPDKGRIISAPKTGTSTPHFPEELSFCEDGVFLLHAMKKSNLMVTEPGAIYNYRINDGGLARNKAAGAEARRCADAVAAAAIAAKMIPTLSAKDARALKKFIARDFLFDKYADDLAGKMLLGRWFWLRIRISSFVKKLAQFLFRVYINKHGKLKIKILKVPIK